LHTPPPGALASAQVISIYLLSVPDPDLFALKGLPLQEGLSIQSSSQKHFTYMD
jgi:hypothetical protein